MIERGLARLFPRSFTARLLSVAFVGIHVPLIILAGWMLFTSDMSTAQTLRVFVIVLVATLLGTGVTTVILYRMLGPLRNAADALDSYYDSRELPQLPDDGQDEIGRLLKGISRSIHGLDKGLRTVHMQAHTDPLTGAWNRRGCEQTLAKSLDQHSPDGEQFTLLVVDMDNLKQVNDQYGHTAGDAALVHVVETARAWLGEHDWVGRWGGDEFLIGAHGKEETVRGLVQRWITELARTESNTHEWSIGVSVGAAHWDGKLSAAALYKAADSAMYQAKFSGGGKLVVASSSQTKPD